MGDNVGSKKFSVTFTHINPSRAAQLKAYLDRGVDCPKSFQFYKNTIEVFLSDENDREDVVNFAIENLQELHQFGFKNEIRMGQNAGILEIINYDKRRGKQFMGYLKNLIGADILEIQPLVNNGRHCIAILLSKSKACVWLDRLLQEGGVKQFQIQGAQQGNKAKMKIFLVCEEFN